MRQFIVTLCILVCLVGLVAVQVSAQSCTKDSDCPSAQVCSLDTCKDVVPVCDYFKGPKQCLDDFYCVPNYDTCVRPTTVCSKALDDCEFYFGSQSTCDLTARKCSYTACDSTSDVNTCGDGYRCLRHLNYCHKETCKVDTHCSPGFHCEKNGMFCVKGQRACTTNDDCKSDITTQDGWECVEQKCAQTCDATKGDSDCPANYTCTSGNTCEPKEEEPPSDDDTNDSGDPDKDSVVLHLITALFSRLRVDMGDAKYNLLEEAFLDALYASLNCKPLDERPIAYGIKAWGYYVGETCKKKDADEILTELSEQQQKYVQQLSLLDTLNEDDGDSDDEDKYPPLTVSVKVQENYATVPATCVNTSTFQCGTKQCNIGCYAGAECTKENAKVKCGKHQRCVFTDDDGNSTATGRCSSASLFGMSAMITLGVVALSILLGLSVM